MRQFQLIVLVLILTSCLLADAQKKKKKGNKNNNNGKENSNENKYEKDICVEKGVKESLTVNGITCEYVECKPSRGKGCRGLKLFSCKNNQGKKMNKFCIYFGENPHLGSCGDTYIKNIDKYYKSLAKSAMQNDAPCAKTTIIDGLKDCGLEYPCIQGDCPRDHANGSDPCQSNLRGLLNATSAPYSVVVTVFVGVLSIFLFKSLY